MMHKMNNQAAMRGAPDTLGDEPKNNQAAEDTGVTEEIQHERGLNTVKLGKGTFDDKNEGDEIEATIKGKIYDDNGEKFIGIDMVNGIATEDMPAESADNTDVTDIGNQLTQKLKQRESEQMGQNTEDQNYA